jgi:hypothetical protein
LTAQVQGGDRDLRRVEDRLVAPKLDLPGSSGLDREGIV